MRKLLLMFILFSVSAAYATPTVVSAPVSRIFIPKGFDNNDNVEVVVKGYFSNPCYSRDKFEVDVKGDVIDIKITSLSTLRMGEYCVEMIIPYKEVVTIGNLQAGKYKVVVNRDSPYEIRDELVVALANSQSVDDHIYAMIDYIDLGITGGQSGTFNLVGWVPSDCFAFDRVELVDNGKDVLSVLPIMKQVTDFCPQKLTPINIPVSFDKQIFKSKEILIFSRTLDGKSVNTIIGSSI